MGASKIRNTWWVDFRYRGIRYRKRSPENSRGGALVHEAVMRQRLTRGEPVDGVPETVNSELTYADFIPEWFQTYVRTNNRESEQRLKHYQLRAHLLPTFGKMKLSDITSLEIERFKAKQIASGRSAKTVKNQLSVLSKSLKTAIDWGMLAIMPKINWPKVEPASFDFLTPQESDRLLAAINESPWREMVLAALRTGMRFGELIALHWDNVDLARRIICVRHSMVHGVIGTPKNNRFRYIPLTEQLHAELSGLPRRQGFVFCREDGRPASKSAADRAMRRFCKRAGLRHIKWHALRHTFASQLTMAGAPMRTVQEFLGHSSMQMTLRYSHLAPSTLQAVIGVLDGLGAADGVLGQQMVNTPLLEESASIPMQAHFCLINQQKSTTR